MWDFKLIMLSSRNLGCIFRLFRRFENRSQMELHLACVYKTMNSKYKTTSPMWAPVQAAVCPSFYFIMLYFPSNYKLTFICVCELFLVVGQDTEYSQHQQNILLFAFETGLRSAFSDASAFMTISLPAQQVKVKDNVNPSSHDWLSTLPMHNSSGKPLMMF